MVCIDRESVRVNVGVSDVQVLNLIFVLKIRNTLPPFPSCSFVA